MLHVSGAWKAAALEQPVHESRCCRLWSLRPGFAQSICRPGFAERHLPAGFHRIPMVGVLDADRPAECVQRVGRAGRSGAVERGLDGSWESGT
jgi:hypothetical protein